MSLRFYIYIFFLLQSPIVYAYTPFDKILVRNDYERLANNKHEKLTYVKSLLEWTNDTIPEQHLNVISKTNQDVAHFYLFKAFNFFRVEDFASSFQYATKAYKKYILEKDTTGITYSLLYMGISSFESEPNNTIFNAHYLNQAYDISKKTKIVEAQLIGLYARIRSLGSRELKENPQSVLELANTYFKLVSKNQKFEYILPRFYQALVIFYQQKNDNNSAFSYSLESYNIFKKNALEVPLGYINSLAYEYLQLKKYVEAKKLYEKGIALHYKNKYASGSLVSLYLFNGYHQTLVGLKQFEKASIYADSIFIYSQNLREAFNLRKIKEISVKYEISKKEQERQLIVKDLELTERKNHIYLLSILILVLIIISFYLVYNLLQLKIKQIKAQNIEIVKLSQTKEFLFQIITHDIRQPLISFQEVASVIRYYLAESNYKMIERLVDEMDSSGAKLYLLCDNLLKWSLDQSNGLSFVQEKVVLREVIDECLLIYKSAISARKIEISINEYTKDATAFVDSKSVFSIFLNIISNAIQHLKSGGMISFDIEKEDAKYISIKISDTGVGIEYTTLSHIKRIFSEKEELIAFDRSINSSLGIGIILINIFIKKNKGFIRIESDLNKGTTFYLKLPTGSKV